MSGELLMLFLFLFLVGTMLFAHWLTTKYKTRLSFFQIIFSVFVLLGVGFWLFVRSISNDEKQEIIQNVQIKSVVINITFDPHKPYFKNMSLADGKYLPMPEKMNDSLTIGDSIYKRKGVPYYKVVNVYSKRISRYPVEVHSRTVGRSE